jgi:uncharacterized protein YjiS (DUF1127 family)
MKVMSLNTATERSTRIAPPRVRRRAMRPSLGQVLSRVFAALHEWRRRSRDRAELARFDERMLRDIGITRVEIWREINQPFWSK